MSKTNFKEIVKVGLSKKGMSMTDLAVKINVNKATLSTNLKKSNPTLTNVIKIAKELDGRVFIKFKGEKIREVKTEK